MSRFLGSPGDPATGLRDAKRELDAFTVATPLDDADWRRLAEWDVADVPGAPGRRTIAEALDDSIGALVAALPDSLPAPEPGGGATEALAADGALARRILVAIKARPARLDVVVDALLPVHADPTTSVQHIDFFRVAGTAPSPAADAFVTRVEKAGRDHKIAGRQLNHLGAFFDRSWRTNDWRWGQLDAVSTLVDAVLDAPALDALRAALTANPAARAELGVAIDDLAPERVGQLQKSLVRCRQGQLIQAFFGLPDGDFTRAVTSKPFIDWVGTDRRLLTKLGRQDLTGVGMRGVLTATNAIKHRLKWWWCTAIEVFVRPVLMGVGGLFLTGRWGAASLAWTVGGLAVPRASSAFSRWALWSISLSLVALVLWFTERKQKLPDRGGVRGVAPFLITGAALVVGTAMFWPGVRNELREPRTWLPDDLPLSVLLAGVAAAIAAACISWWMRRRSWLAFTVVVFAWYAMFARASARAAAGERDWMTWGPLRQVWVAWLVAIVAAPFVFSFLSTPALGGPDAVRSEADVHTATRSLP